jgi:ubiquinone/menaquinone biosynthesis C-methylase UbiE
MTQETPQMGSGMTASEAAIYESLVVSRYIQVFGDAAVPMLLPFNPAAVAHLGCRTGYPAAAIGRQLNGCSVTGVDASSAALELARTKASLIGGVVAQYVHSEGLPTPLQENVFTHAFSLHPVGTRGDYGQVFAEHYRLLLAGGQMVMSMPLRGSFPEIYDILREYALRHDQPHFGEAVDAASTQRPTPETLAKEIEAAGFMEVDVGVDLVAITFENGREFLEDPIASLVVGPDIRSSIPVDSGVDHAWDYARHAIAMYWSEIPFELTVNIGSVSARKPS